MHFTEAMLGEARRVITSRLDEPSGVDMALSRARFFATVCGCSLSKAVDKVCPLGED